jgi:hypothetical protein
MMERRWNLLPLFLSNEPGRALLCDRIGIFGPPRFEFEKTKFYADVWPMLNQEWIVVHTYETSKTRFCS